MTGLNGIEGLGQAPGCAAAVQKVPCHGLPRVAPRRSHSVVVADEGSSPWESLRGYTRRAGPREPLAQALNVPPRADALAPGRHRAAAPIKTTTDMGRGEASSSVGSGRGAVDQVLSPAPERADIQRDHDRRRGGEGSDHRERDAVLSQILALIVDNEAGDGPSHFSSSQRSPPLTGGATHSGRATSVPISGPE